MSKTNPTEEEINKFSKFVEESALQKKCDFLDFIVSYCEETGLEIDMAAVLISDPLKMKIREQAETINLLKSESRLPI